MTTQLAIPAVQALRPDLGQLHPVHRLDKPVSGVLLLARSPAAAARLNTKVAVRTRLRPKSVEPCDEVDDSLLPSAAHQISEECATEAAPLCNFGSSMTCFAGW